MEPISMEIDGTQQLSSDNLVPDIVVEEAGQELGSEPYDDEQPSYVPIELVKPWCSNDASILYHFYIIELEQKYSYDFPVIDIVLGLRSELDSDIANMQFDLEVGRGTLRVNFKHAGEVHLSSEQVHSCRRFQITIFQLLIDRNVNKLEEVLNSFCSRQNLGIDYILLPATNINLKPLIFDWACVPSVLFPSEERSNDHIHCSLPNHCSRVLHTKNGIFCACKIQNSLVCTPHNGRLYCITGLLDDLNGNSILRLRAGRVLTYKAYFKKFGINLHFDQQLLLKGRPIFVVQNFLDSNRPETVKEPSHTSVELPPELCSIIISPVSASSVYSFSFVPSIMHRLESLLVAVNLKKKILYHCRENFIVPTTKVLEAITTKSCQEKFHLESLETLGDSFLKYAACQQLFKTHQNNREGFLTAKKNKIISNAALCKLGCDRKVPGFIQNESFDPKKWVIPGDYRRSNLLSEELPLNERDIYIRGRRKVKSETVADVVEALIGAFLSTGGEQAAIYFLNWIGINVNLAHIPYERNFKVQPEKLIDVGHLQSILNYSFRDPSLLVEALTHGSYMLPEIPGGYQRLEFLGDAVLDYLITIHLYDTYPGMSPGMLTDMRSASVNNDCYALSAMKAGLHKHILHVSDKLQNDIACAMNNLGSLSIESTFGWDCETSLPKVLGDIIESLAGAIYIDSGYDTNIVFQSIRPLLEPLISPETMRLHPVRELNEHCQKMHYNKKKSFKSFKNGVATVTVEVEANGTTHKHTSTALEKNTAKRLASKVVLRSLKETSLE